MLLAAVVATCVGIAHAIASPTATGGAPDTGRVYIRMLNGLETVRLDATGIVVYRGSASDNSARYLINFPRSIVARVTDVGLNGRDNVATPEDLRELSSDMQSAPASRGGFTPVYRDGHRFAGLPLSGWYMPVYSADAAGRPAVFLTRQQSSQRLDRAGDAAIPPRFVARRNAPIAHYFDAEHGFRPMVCHGWPQPFCVWTRIPPYSQTLTIVADGRGTEHTEIDARRFVPGTGRLISLQVIVRGRTHGGSVRLFTLPRGDGLLAGAVSRQGDVHVSFLTLALTSARRFYYQVDPGVSVEINAIGFSMLQPN